MKMMIGKLFTVLFLMVMPYALGQTSFDPRALYQKGESPQGTVCLFNATFFNPIAYNAESYPDYVKLPISPDGVQYLDLNKLAKLEVIMSQAMQDVVDDPECDFIWFTQHPSEKIPGYQGVTLIDITKYRQMLYDVSEELGLELYQPNDDGEVQGEII